MKNFLLIRKASSLLFWGFALLFLLISGKGYGQAYKEDFGNSATVAVPYTSGTNATGGVIKNTNLTNPVWTQSLTSANFGGNTLGAMSASLTGTTYTVTCTFTVASGFQLTPTSVGFDNRGSGTGPNALTITISGTGGSTSCSPTPSRTGAFTTTAATNFASTTQNLTGNITLTLALTGGASGSTERLDNIILNGTVTATTTAPLAPTITAITPGNGQLSVAFTAGGNGGSAITNYKYSTDGGTNFTACSPTQTTSPIVITGLTNGTSYNVQIKAVNAIGDGTATVSTVATPRTTPSAPTIGTITPGIGQLSVAFTAGSDGGSAITNYKYSLNGGSFVSAGSTSSPIVITGLTNGTSYNVQLLAVNVAGDGTASGASAGTPRTSPSAVTGLTATAGNSQVTLAFTAGSNGGSAITDYVYSLNGGSFTSAGTTTSPIVVTGLTNGTSYSFVVKAVNAAGNGTASSTVSATPRTTASAPSITTITPGDSSLSVAFTAPSSNGGAAITDYKYSINGGSSFISAGSTTSPIGISGLTNGTTYDVQLLAVNAAGDGAPSATVQGTPVAASTATITTNKSSVTAFSTIYGTASSTDNFTVSGAALTDNITITAPSGFEVSTTSNTSGFGASQVLTQTSGVVSTTTVYVRLSAAASFAGSPYTGDFVLSSAGATNATVATNSSTVAKKGLTISGLTGVDRVYDGTTIATVSGTAILDGIVGLDDVNLIGSTPTYSFLDANAGVSKPITVLGYTLNGGAAGNYSLSQPALTATISKANQTIAAISSSETRTFGDGTYSVATTASSGLTVTYSNSVSGVASVALNGTVTIAGGGSTIITASQAGNTNFNAAPDVTQSLTVNKANQTLSAITATVSKTFGDAAYSAASTASSGLTVSYSSDNTLVATVSGAGLVTVIGAGTATITASQAGNANYNAATSVTQFLTVGKANQTITGLASNDTRATGAANYSLTATAPGGTVTYTSSNTNVATISGSTVTIVGAGTSTITASQAGNTNYNAATAIQTLTVTQAIVVLSKWALTSTTTTATTTATGVTNTAITVSSGSITYSSPSLVATTWSTSSTYSAAGKYWEFSITPTSGYTMNLSSVTFDAGRTTAGPQKIDVYYSTDGFVSSNVNALSGASNANTSGISTFTLTTLPTGDLLGTVKFRVFGYAATSTGNFKFNNVTINGYAALCSGTVPSISSQPATQSVCTGNAINLSVTASPAAAYQWRKNSTPISGATSSTYTIASATSIDSASYDVIITGSTGCALTTSNPAVVTVNESPTAVTITPSSATFCNGTIQQLTASSTYVAINSLGAGTATTSAAVTTSAIGPNPFQNYYGGVKQQMLVLASTLNTLGLANGSTISALQLQMAVADNTYALSNLKVKLQNTTATSVSTTAMVTTGWSTVYSPASYTPTAGYTNIPFSSNFTWNGTNLLIEISYTNANTGSTTTATNTAYYSTTSFVSSAIYVADNIAAATMDAYAAAPSYTYSTRNNFKFSFTKPATISWSPAADLYTDSGTNTGYTLGNAAATVYAKPSASTSYIATATANTCTTTNTVALTVNPLPTPSISAGGATTFCDGGSVTLTASAGASYLWSNGATTQAITVSVSGSYSVAVTNANGCTATSAATVVTVTPNTTNTTTVSACDTYTWSVNEQTYTTSGTRSVVTGCHTEVLDLTITPSSISPDVTISACDTYTWSFNGQTYTTSGDYTSTVNCNTTILHLTITPSSTNTTTASACDSYTWNGATYNASGLYTGTTANCVTQKLDLTITPSSDNVTVISACDSYTWNGTTYNASGLYTGTTANCVTQKLDLIITPSSDNVTVVSVCDSYTWNGTTYNASGLYTGTTSNCVTQKLDLTITPSSDNLTVISEWNSYTLN
ncbi:fibronectin type III domain-containing protein [Flavobacterium sp.]|uniref:beta strand repeat-containing protein n=1 Tax=Flavobacterium sp. TaxID=239 RepID=UPI00286ADA35|nr:fibronectin type III domain-containing protein [Flavobacterium sp.]